MSVDSLSKDTGMTSSGDDFCDSNRITSATSAAVTVSKYERDDELVRVTGGYNKEDVDASLSRRRERHYMHLRVIIRVPENVHLLFLE